MVLSFGLPKDAKKSPICIKTLLESTPCGTLVWHKRGLVSADNETTLADALLLMNKNNIQSLPILDKPGGTIYGIITMFELMYFIAFGHVPKPNQSLKAELKEFSTEWLSTMHIKTLLPLSKDVTYRPQYVDASRPLSEILPYFLNGHHKLVVRIPKDLIHGIPQDEYRLLSQSDLISYISQRIEDHAGLLIKCHELAQSRTKKLITVPETCLAIEALKTMVIHDVNAVVVTEQDTSRYLTTFSSSDLRRLTSKTLPRILSGTVTQLLKSFEKAYFPQKPPCMCGPNETLLQAIHKAAIHHVHRVWLVDRNYLPVAALSLTDLLKAVHSVVV